jgi:hypothetical protein
LTRYTKISAFVLLFVTITMNAVLAQDSGARVAGGRYQPYGPIQQLIFGWQTAIDPAAYRRASVVYAYPLVVDTKNGLNLSPIKGEIRNFSLVVTLAETRDDGYTYVLPKSRRKEIQSLVNYAGAAALSEIQLQSLRTVRVLTNARVKGMAKQRAHRLIFWPGIAQPTDNRE